MLVLLVMSATLTMVMSSEHSLEGLLSNRGVSGANQSRMQKMWKMNENGGGPGSSRKPAVTQPEYQLSGITRQCELLTISACSSNRSGFAEACRLGEAFPIPTMVHEFGVVGFLDLQKLNLG